MARLLAAGPTECCPAPSARPPGADEDRAVELARVLRALADPTRVRLVTLIAAHGDAEACVCDLTAPVGLSQPTVSHHLKQLVDAGVLRREQRGRWAFYALVDGALAGIAGDLLRIQP